MSDPGFPLVQLVSSLDDDSVVLFDFNPRRWDDWDRVLGEPGASPLGEPSWSTSPTGVVEGTREITLPLLVHGSSAESQMALLAELLTRTSTVWLQWQTWPDSDPVWFEVVPPTAGGGLDFEHARDTRDAAIYQWQVTLTAKAFARGQRIYLSDQADLVHAGQVVQSAVEITDDIQGSAPAPLCMDIDAGNLSGWQCRLISWAMAPDATRSPYVLAYNSDLSGNKASNGNLQFAGNTFGIMGTYSTSDPAKLPPPGQYRGLAYVLRTAGTGTCTISLKVAQESGIATSNDDRFKGPPLHPVTPAGASIGFWVDTGPVNLPLGQPPEQLREDLLASLTLGIYAQTSNDASTTWQVSHFLLVPVWTVKSRSASTALSTYWDFYPADNDTAMRIDSEGERVYAVDVSATDPAARPSKSVAPPALEGGFPILHPGARNFLMFIPRVNDAEGSHRHGGYGTSGVTKMWYRPRYLHLGEF